MVTTFICHHCGKRCLKNPRLKCKQKYCVSRECQQVRKNTWERKKLCDDVRYKSRRQAAKKRWYSKKPGDKYQSEYRKSHPDYCTNNRKNQVKYRQKQQLLAREAKVVKTDTLIHESSSPQELYMLLPYKINTDALKVVKIDALIVRMVATQGAVRNFLVNSVSKLHSTR